MKLLALFDDDNNVLDGYIERNNKMEKFALDISISDLKKYEIIRTSKALLNVFI